MAFDCDSGLFLFDCKRKEVKVCSLSSSQIKIKASIRVDVEEEFRFLYVQNDNIFCLQKKNGTHLVFSVSPNSQQETVYQFTGNFFHQSNFLVTFEHRQLKVLDFKNIDQPITLKLDFLSGLIGEEIPLNTENAELFIPIKLSQKALDSTRIFLFGHSYQITERCPCDSETTHDPFFDFNYSYLTNNVQIKLTNTQKDSKTVIQGTIKKEQRRISIQYNYN